MIQQRTFTSKLKHDTWELFGPFIHPEYRTCMRCEAKLLPSESDNFCCQSGNVKVVLPDMPEKLLQFIFDKSKLSSHFRDHIRSYNCLLAFTSNGVNLDDIPTTSSGVYTLRVQGAFCHRMRSLLPGKTIY